MKSDIPPPKWTKALLAQRRKNALAMALVLLGLVVLFFAITIVRMGGG